MEDDVISEAGEAHRKCIADEVHAMPPLSEGNSQFRGDDPASAVRGITSNSDVHFVFLSASK